MTTTGAPDVTALIGQLDLPTKVRLLTGATLFTLAPHEPIGLGEVRLSDGPTGVRGLQFQGGRRVALFPNATLLASAWNEESAAEVGRMLAEEALAQGVHVVLGPTINLHRSPLGGRLFEAFSEDPLLTGKLAAAYVRGMQELGVGACLKHLVANESETERNTVDSVLDEATLRELYLLPFEIAAAESDPWSMMAAYNDVNGTAATEHHHVITEIVRGEWGWPGLVMSDWFATRTAAAAANGGLDLVMPGPAGPWGEALVDAVRAGEVTETVVDEHLARLLLLADRVGALGVPRSWPDGLPAPDSAVRRDQLTRLAAEGMTVLTDDGVLPLARGGTVALVGRHALETICMGGGSAKVNPPYQVSVAEGLTALLGDAVRVCDGVEVRDRALPAGDDVLTDPGTGEPGVRVTLLAEDGAVLRDRHETEATALVGMDDEVDGVVHAVRFRARLRPAGQVVVGSLGVGSWQVRVGDATRDWQLAVSGGGFAEEVLAPPTRTEPFDVPAGTEVEATVVLGPGAPQRMLGLVARTAPLPEADVLAAAVALARDADVAVVVVGLTEEQETEAVDKSTLRLPGTQDAMVSAVAAAARRTVVVVNAATPVLMPWRDEVDAVLWAGLPGQEGGHAVAAALLGDVEPAGRLVTTFPAADGASPAWSVTPVDGRLHYAEGTAIGHRGHDAGLAPAPAFWFGHGLGYGTWDWSEAAVDPAGPAVTCRVTNTGTRTSREVVQAYLRPATAGQPVRLVGWAAVTVGPGASAEVRVPCDRRLWRRWDAASGSWDTLRDGGTLLLARGLGDVRATLPLLPT